MDYIKDEHRVHLIAYHLIWCVKRRKPFLVGNMKEECEKLIKEKCEQKYWNIISISVMPEHIHLFVRANPTTSAFEIAKECKGYVAFNMRPKFEILHKLPCMWTKSYFASTAGNISSEIIQRYIDSQKGL